MAFGGGGEMEETRIRDVWASNLEEEMAKIRELVERYPYIAMDTEFPGVVAKPIGTFRNQGEYQYQLLRVNVDLLKLIQLGLTFFDEEGKTPLPHTTWQFNFKYDLSEEMWAEDSIGLLTRAGLHFDAHATDGIDPLYFAEVLMSSGLVLNDDVYWITFHSGYDFGYLMRLLTNKAMPEQDREFFELLRIYFPTIYDIKYLMRSCKTLKGGLQDVADELGARRLGQQHQAGSDSHLTGETFFKMRNLFFEGFVDNEKFNGMIFGYNSSR
eukprot:m.438303 g.438303  ORF g.438303 m.438303 type:complete len:269 (-) comp18222_c0_seq1:250-1056(-)